MIRLCFWYFVAIRALRILYPSLHIFVLLYFISVTWSFRNGRSMVLYSPGFHTETPQNFFCVGTWQVLKIEFFWTYSFQLIYLVFPTVSNLLQLCLYLWTFGTYQLLKWEIWLLHGQVTLSYKFHRNTNS